MALTGYVQNGVIVLTGGVTVPEGTPVTVSCDIGPGSPPSGVEKNWVQLPLVQTDEPGSIKLTSERIAEIFEEEDIASARRFFPDPQQD